MGCAKAKQWLKILTAGYTPFGKGKDWLCPDKWEPEWTRSFGLSSSIAVYLVVVWVLVVLLSS